MLENIMFQKFGKFLVSSISALPILAGTPAIADVVKEIQTFSQSVNQTAHSSTSAVDLEMSPTSSAPPQQEQSEHLSQLPRVQSQTLDISEKQCRDAKFRVSTRVVDNA